MTQAFLILTRSWAITPHFTSSPGLQPSSPVGHLLSSAPAPTQLGPHPGPVGGGGWCVLWQKSEPIIALLTVAFGQHLGTFLLL